MAAALILVAAHVVSRPPLLDRYSYSRAVYDRRGELLRLTLAEDQQYRLRVSLDTIPAAVIDATCLYEDRYFFWHPGVNPVALVRAALHTYWHRTTPRGASTITMQLARLHFGLRSRTIPGKLLQILRAVQLELHYSKNEILEAYLNLAPYGGNVQGVGAASLVYFRKPVRQLRLAEAMALALMPQDPNQRARLEDGHEGAELFAMRRRLGAAWMQRHPETAPHQLALRFALPMHGRATLPFGAPHFVNAIMTRSDVEGTVHTTLDSRFQDLLECRAKEYLERRQNSHLTNVAALLVDHGSMEILASLGSADFDNAAIDGQVDGTKAKRSPGSALKPFIYALAMEEGIIHPRSLLKDAPMRFGAYNPENFSGDFAGPLSATDALIRSRNVPAVYLESQLQGGGLHGLLARVGISGLKERDHYGLALVLGGLEVTMEELAVLYAMLQNRGRFKELESIMGQPRGRTRSVLSPAASTLTVAMLRENRRPNQAFDEHWIADRDEVAWKTGTSYGYRDAWAVGIAGPFVLAVWVGNFDGTGNPAFIGRKAAAPLFFHVVDALRPHVAERTTHAASATLPPDTVEEVDVCAVSGRLPQPHCPRTTRTGFIPGVSPIERCQIHRIVEVNRVTGLRACNTEVEPVTERVYEFWPSDLGRLFARAGLPRRKPPPYPASCDLERRVFTGLAPEITSPQPEMVYTVRSGARTRRQLPLMAISDADVRELHWFADAEYLGRTPQTKPLFWTLQPGDYVIRVVDDTGRASAQALQIELAD